MFGVKKGSGGGVGAPGNGLFGIFGLRPLLLPMYIVPFLLTLI